VLALGGAVLLRRYAVHARGGGRLRPLLEGAARAPWRWAAGAARALLGGGGAVAST
jgi:hypothetical protein